MEVGIMAFKLSQAENAREIGGTEKSPVVIFTKEWRGETYVDIRTFWSPDPDDEPIATKKGAMFPLSEALEVAEYLAALVAAQEE
jgi:hypothetical protein